MKRTIKRLDTVRILKYPVDHINGYARVERVDRHNKIVTVSNMNMPFQGTLGNEPFYFHEVEPV